MKILKRIGLFAVAILMAVGAVFLPKTLKSANADTTVSDGVQTFISSDLITSNLATVPSVGEFGSLSYSDLIYANNNSVLTTSDYRAINTSFKIERSIINGVVYVIGYVKSYYYNNGVLDFVDIHPYTLSELNRNVQRSEGRVVDVAYQGSYTRSTAFTFGFYNPNAESSMPSSEFLSVDLTIVSIEIGNVSSSEFSYLTFDGVTNANVVVYTTSQGIQFYFLIPNWDPVSLNDDYNLGMYYSYRKYYTSNAFDFSNQGYYQQGLIDGYANGFDSGKNVGYREGSVAGYDNGFEVGKQEGILSSQNYTFFGLITAVIDAPVRILTSLFNFNFLGINLWLFITSILTISLVVVVLRKFMGKG